MSPSRHVGGAPEQEARPLAPHGSLSRWSRLRHSPATLLAGIWVVAYLIRLTPILAQGGLNFFGRYDDGVYYAAADALTFGRVPYRDFVLLHPPGIVLALAPFALLGRLTSDPTGLAVARLAFMAIGATNALLVARLALRWSRAAALAAGLMYACCLPAVYDEQTTLLEALGGLLILVALQLLVKTRRPPTVRAELIAGALLGLSVGVKIWYVAIWLLIVAWQLVARRVGAALRLAAAGTVALVILVLPFAVLARGRMFDMVVRDQVLRPQAKQPILGRLTSIFDLQPFLLGHPVPTELGIAVALVVAGIAAYLFITDPTARILVALLAVDLIVLLASPSYFQHYAALSAAGIALILGLAFARWMSAARGRPALAGLGVVAMLLVVASGVKVALTHYSLSFVSHQVSAAAPPGCVTSDDPGALAELNRLSQDLRSGCHVDIDVTGVTYDRLHRTTANGQGLPRPRNLAFQRYLYDYLVSGRSFLVARGAKGDGMNASTIRLIARQPVIAQSGMAVLHVGLGAS